jgi:hypothetical protein
MEGYGQATLVISDDGKTKYKLRSCIYRISVHVCCKYFIFVNCIYIIQLVVVSLLCTENKFCILKMTQREQPKIKTLLESFKSFVQEQSRSGTTTNDTLLANLDYVWQNYKQEIVGSTIEVTFKKEHYNTKSQGAKTVCLLFTSEL